MFVFPLNILLRIIQVRGFGGKTFIFMKNLSAHLNEIAIYANIDHVLYITSTIFLLSLQKQHVMSKRLAWRRSRCHAAVCILLYYADDHVILVKHNWGTLLRINVGLWKSIQIR